MNGTLAVRWPLAHGSWKPLPRQAPVAWEEPLPQQTPVAWEEPLPQQTPAAWEERVCGNDIVRNVLQ